MRVVFYFWIIIIMSFGRTCFIIMLVLHLNEPLQSTR